MPSSNIILQCRNCQDKEPKLFQDKLTLNLSCYYCNLIIGKFIEKKLNHTIPIDFLLNNNDNVNQLDSSNGSNKSEVPRFPCKSDDHLIKSFKEIVTLCEAQRYPISIVITAKCLYQIAWERRLFSGRQSNIYTVAAVYTSLERHAFPVSLDEMSTVALLSRKRLTNAHRAIATETNCFRWFALESTVELICQMLQFNDSLLRNILQFQKNLQNQIICNYFNPLDLTLASVYLVANLVGTNVGMDRVTGTLACDPAQVKQIYGEMYTVRNALVRGIPLDTGTDIDRLPSPDD